MLIAKKANETLEDRGHEKLKKLRGKRKALKTVPERDFEIALNERRHETSNLK
jgi:hypothetical protein